MLLPSPSGMAHAQKRKVMNRPYIDQRKFHYGFLAGMQLQDIELEQNGFVSETGDQWFVETPNYEPGFSVGMLGEFYLTKNLGLRLIPTMHFGTKNLTFRNNLNGDNQYQVIKSTYITLPVDVKFSAPRYNNFRPYFVAGAAPSIDLAGHKHRAIRTKPMDCFIEFGMGCDIYLPFFKLIPELKFSFGLLDILNRKRSDLIDGTLMKYTNSVDKAHSKMITLTIYFE